MYKRKGAGCALLLAVALGLSACGAPAAMPQASKDAAGTFTPAAVTDTAQTVSAENDHLRVTLDKDTAVLTVTDKANGGRFESAVPASKLDREPNELWANAVRALVSLTCVDGSKKSNDTLTKNNVGEKAALSARPVDSGFEVTLDFSALQIQTTIRFLLKDDRLQVVIPDGGIKEAGKYQVVDVTLLPYLGHAQDTDDGYFLYPNGSGELFRFKDKSLRQNAVKEYTLPLYSPFALDMESRYALSEFDRDEMQIMLPAFGVKLGDNGFAAILEKGDADAAVQVTPGGVGVAVSRIAAVFTYRHQYQVEGAGLNISGGTSQFPLAQLYDKKLIPGDRVLTYAFLSGPNADYSGMARAVRENLINRGALPAQRKDAAMPLSLELFMGVTREQLIFDEFIVTTDFSQAGDILRSLKERGVDNLFATLIGWQKDGYGSGCAQPAAGKLGGASGLEELADYCRESGVRLLADANLTDILKGSTAYSASADTAKDQNGFVYQDAAEEHLLFGPHAVWRRGGELFRYLKDRRLSGACFQDIGAFLYSDRSKGAVSDRRQTMAVWENLLAVSKEQLGTAAAEGGNAYVLRHADLVKNIRESSDSILFSDETVPFYQMVTHGSVLYTGEAVNLYYDETAQLLRLVEYGYTPRFELTYERAAELRDTAYNMLFSSRFSNWEERLAEIYGKLSRDLDGLWNQPMTAHEAVGDSVFKTTYADGSAVYVNYGAAAFESGGVRVEPQAYIVVKGDAG